MKKFLLSAFALAVALSAAAFNMAPTVEKAQLGTPMNAKQAPKEMVAKMIQKTIATKAPQAKLNTPVTKASDMEGGYTWNYEMANSWGVDPEAVTTTATGSDPVVFFGADDEAGTVKIAGMFSGVITATIDTETYAQYDAVALTLSDEDLAANTTNYGACYIKGVFYYDSDDEDEAGWYYTDPTIFVLDDEIFFASNVWMFREIATGQYAGYYLTPLWKPSSEMVVNNDFNGIMEYEDSGFNYVSALGITEDTENYVVSVKNFAGMADADKVATFNLDADHTWYADPSVILVEDTLNFQLVGLTPDTSFVYLEGTGTETQLTFGSTWTLIDIPTGYWYGFINPATITLVGGEFVYPEEVTIPDVYILGEVGENTWAPNVGQQMALDEESGLYTAEIVCDGRNDGFNFFSFTTKLADNADDWDAISGYRFGAVSNGDFLVTDDMLGIDLSLTKENYQAFKIPAGTYNLTVNYADMKLKIEKQAAPGKPGDANNDGVVDVNDVTTVINYILQKNPTPFNFDNANVNGDETVDVMDVTLIIDMILHPNA